MTFGSSAYGSVSYGEGAEPLFDEVAHHLAAAMAAYRAGDDPALKEHVQQLYDTVRRLNRKLGRPEIPRGKSMTEPEKHAAHYATSGDYKKTAEAFRVKEDTVRRNVAKVDKGY